MFKKAIILFAIVLFPLSCQKQSPGEIEPDYLDSLSEVRRGEACSNTTLAEDVLYHDNLVNLFVCTEWDKKFPKMFEALGRIENKSWDKVFTPINEEVVNDRSLRSRFIDLISELDKKEGLEDLSKVMVSLSDSNFFKHTYDILNCTQSESGCLRGLSRKELEVFFAFFKLSKEDLIRLSKILGATSMAFKGEGSSLEDNLKKNLSSKNFVLLRNEFLNQLILELNKDEFKDEIDFYNKLIGSKEGVIGWLPIFMRNDVAWDEAVSLLRYPVDRQPTMWKDFRLLNQMLSLSLPCSLGGKENEFSVLINEHMNTFMNILFKQGHEEFINHSIQSMLLLKGAREVCPNLSSYSGKIYALSERYELSHDIDFIGLLEQTSQLLSEEYAYSFVKSLHHSHPLSREDDLFLLNFFAKDLFVSWLRLVKETSGDRDGFMATLYDFTKSFPDNGYVSIGELLDWLKNKDDSELDSLVQTWNELGEDGRFFVFNFLDAHFRDAKSITLLFDFYNASLNVGSTSFENILEAWFSQENITSTLMAFNGIFGSFTSEELLPEFRVFFSSEHLLEILRLLSTGRVPDESRVAMSDFFIEEENTNDTRTIVSGLFSTSRNTRCLEEISSASSTLSSLLGSLPSACLDKVGKDPLIDLFSGINTFTNYQKQSKPGYTPGPHGLFSGDSIRLVTAVIKELDLSLGGTYSLLKRVSTWSEISSVRKNLNELFEGLNILMENNEGGIFSDFIKFYSRDDNFRELPVFFDAISLALDDYKNYRKGSYLVTERDFEYEQKYACSNFHKNIGSRPCPSSNDLLTVYQRAIKLLLRRNDANPTGLEQLIKMVSSDYGLPIPYDSKNARFKRITFEESFRTLYDLTNKDLEVNKTQIEYHPVPASVKDYFENEDWLVTKKQGKGASKPYDVSMTTMERVETVIRDVRFDKNYLGAHYLNAVAKAEDYDKTVDSKFGLFKRCVPLKFCGKFMNRAQHRLGKNSKDTFKALADVNLHEDWRYGSYMQALISSLVSSSPDKSQVSSITRRRILGINLDIPWLQSKKDLAFHNGQVLGLVTMVNGFTNGARIIRDRVGRNKAMFESFLNSGKLQNLDKSLFKNFIPNEDLPQVEKLLKNLDGSGFLESFFDYFGASSYEKQRLAESILFKGFYLTSFIADEKLSARYKNNSLFDLIEVVNALVSKNEFLSQHLKLNDESYLLTLNRVLDVFVMGLEDERKSKTYSTLLNEVVLAIKSNKNGVVQAVNYVFSDKVKGGKVIAAMHAVDDVTEDIYSKGSIDLLRSTIQVLKASRTLSWNPVKKAMKLSVAKKVCTKELVCRENSSYRELSGFIAFLTHPNSNKIFSFLDYVSNESDAKIKDLFDRVFPSLILE